MNRIIFALMLAAVFLGCATGKGKPLVQTDFQLMKAEQDAQIVKLQGENSALRLQAQSLEAKLNAQASAIAGFNNKVQTMSAGRDNISKVDNDSELLKFIFDKWYLVIAGLFGFILTLMGGVWGIVQFVVGMCERVIRGKDEELSRLLRTNSEKEAKLDKWQGDLIEKLIPKQEAQK